MTLLNPLTLAFWFTVVPGLSGAGPNPMKDQRLELPMICLGVFIGTISWVVAFSGLLAWARRAGEKRRNGWLVLADIAGGVTLIAFAIATFWRLIRPSL